MNVVPFKKTKPLSAHALAELGHIIKSPEPCLGINPGVVQKLTREGLAEIVWLPSPFKTHKGGNIAHLKVTSAGVSRWLKDQ